MDTPREMYQLAGVRAWQEAILEAMREAGPEVRNRFLEHLQRKGHLSMVAVESSGFANKATVEPSAAAVEPAPRPTVPDEGIDVEEDEKDEGDPRSAHEAGSIPWSGLGHVVEGDARGEEHAGGIAEILAAELQRR